MYYLTNTRIFHIRTHHLNICCFIYYDYGIWVILGILTLIFNRRIDSSIVVYHVWLPLLNISQCGMNRLGDAMVSVFALSDIEHRSGQTKCYNFGICRFPFKHVLFRSKNKDLFVLSKVNVSALIDMSTSRQDRI